MILADITLTDVFWSMLVFFFFFIWIMILFQVFIDLFRDQEESGEQLGVDGGRDLRDGVDDRPRQPRHRARVRIIEPQLGVDVPRWCGRHDGAPSIRSEGPESSRSAAAGASRPPVSVGAARPCGCGTAR